MTGLLWYGQWQIKVGNPGFITGRSILPTPDSKEPLWRFQISPSYQQDYEAYLAWLEEQNQSEFFRIAYHGHWADHAFGSHPMDSGVALYRYGYTPAKLFSRFPESREEELYDALSVRYEVTPTGRPIDHQKFRAEPRVELVKEFSSFKVAERTNFKSKRFTVLGKANANLQSFSPHEIEISVANAAPGDRLRLHTAAFPKWQAYVNNQKVPITVANVFPGRAGMLMEIPVTDGRVSFRYERTGVEKAGMLLTGMGLLGVILCLSLSQLQSTLIFLEGRGMLISVAVGLVGIGIGGFSLNKVLAGQFPRKPNSMAEWLPDAQVSDGDTCRYSDGKWQCATGKVEYGIEKIFGYEKNLCQSPSLESRGRQ